MRSATLIRALALLTALMAAPAAGQQLAPGRTIELRFDSAGPGPTLYTMVTGDVVPPILTFRLPDDYQPGKSYPLLVYVPGLHGGRAGDIGRAESMVGLSGWIVATVPLFKVRLDQAEPAQGIIVSLEDYPTISKAYATMLGRLFELVPNIDRSKSGMVGFSNGALTLAVLLSSHDAFVRTHFRSFVLVDHGATHLTDLHKSDVRDGRYLLLFGDQPDYGRDLKLRGCALQQDSWRLLGVDVTCEIMKGYGHAFPPEYMARVGAWLNGLPAAKAAPR